MGGGYYKKLTCVSAVIINIGILAILKYTNLGINTLNIISAFFFQQYNRIENVSWIASLAISFYTLQMISYLLDVYWEKIEPIRNPLKLLLYCIYFPQMVSGPISRFDEISNDLFGKHQFRYDSLADGLLRIALGLLKKLSISNRLVLVVDYMWTNPQIYDKQWVWVVLFVYIFQLYTDFSGCMDIIIGSSMCFDIHLPENFKSPFLSKNTQEFWRRWHITLGTWLRDYIMIPIQRSKTFSTFGKFTVNKIGKKWGRRIPTYMAMLVLWLAMGIWHGSSWKYVGEGLWFWLVIVLGQIFEIKKKTRDEGRVYKAFQVIRTLLIYSFGMMFFRASSFIDAIHRIKLGIGLNFSFRPLKLLLSFVHANITFKGCVLLAVSLLFLFWTDTCIYDDKNPIGVLRRTPVIFRWIIYLTVVCIICMSFAVAHQAFEYAQF